VTANGATPAEQSQHHERPREVDIVALLRETDVLSDGASADTPMGTSVAERFLEVMQDTTRAEQFIEKLFPDGVPTDASFFHRLFELRRWIGVGDIADQAIGHLWSVAMSGQSPAEQAELLTAFIEQSNPRLFQNLRCLHVVLGDHCLPTEFATEWFSGIAKKVERDCAQGSFWTAVKAYCERHSTNALQLLWTLARTPEHTRLGIAAFVLGVLRTTPLDDEQQADFERVESFFANHDEPAFRSVFSRSWATTAHENGMTADQLRSLLSRAETAADGDKDDVISAVARIILSEKIPTHVFDLGSDWIGENVASSLSSVAKYHVANTATSLSIPDRTEHHASANWSDWLVAIQPVAVEELGTWEAIESCLTLKQANGDG